MSTTVPAAQGESALRGPVALRLTGVNKTFAGTRALIDVDLEINHGEIHALIGGNGSGKSTLLKIMAGIYHADPGGVAEQDGKRFDLARWKPAQAFDAGMRFVHQNPGVFLDLSVAENMAIGHGFPTAPAGRIRWRALHERTRELIGRYHIRATPKMPVRALNPADRTMVAVARALQDQDGTSDGILFLDEPTSALPAADIEVLLQALRRCAAAGQTIVFVSHRIDEVLAFADRVTVLRDGRKVATADVADLTEADVIELIAGRSLAGEPTSTPDSGAGDVVLEVAGVDVPPLAGVDLTLYRGEILGIAGLLGSGRTELLRTVFGARPAGSGTIRLYGNPVQFRDPAQAMAAGVAYVPEDRAGEAAFDQMSVRENISAGSMRRYFRKMRLQHGRERHDARTAMREFLVRAASEAAPLAALSGGNQQKVILARWLRREPTILLLDEPTQGVDVGARAEIYGLIRQAATAGATIVVVANDFEELARLCSRVVVLRGGRIAAELRGTEIDSHRMTTLAYLSEDGGSR